MPSPNGAARWTDDVLVEIEKFGGPVTPWSAPTDRGTAPASWPRTGDVGAKQTMDVDTVLPAPLAARPYAPPRPERLGEALQAIWPQPHRSWFACAIGWFRR